MLAALKRFLLSFIPREDYLTREEAANFLLERDVYVRYRPLIVEMDR